MNRIISKFIKFNFVFLMTGLFIMTGIAKAEDRIDVEYQVGTNLNGQDIFDYSNITPGWEESKTIRVENDSNQDVDLFFRFDVNGDDKLAKKLKLYVIRVENGSYRIGGSGDRYDLDEADDEDLFVDKLSAHKGKEYRIKIKFDENAGNEYQGLEIDFDIDFEIESQISRGQTEEEILADQGRVVSGDVPEIESAQDESVEIEAASTEGGQETPEGEPSVAGEQTECNNWPWWVWAILLVGYLAVFYRMIFNKIREESKEIPWKLEAVLSLLVIVFWWYFDSCRDYLWFLFGSLGGSAFEYLIFLKVRKQLSDKKIK